MIEMAMFAMALIAALLGIVAAYTIGWRHGVDRENERLSRLFCGRQMTPVVFAKMQAALRQTRPDWSGDHDN